jgi:AraC-like DNA-binding protein
MTLGRAKLAIGQGLSVWVLEALGGFGDAQFHRHHAIQITVSLSGHLILATENERIAAPAVAVAADARHRFEADGLIVFLIVEPEGRAGRALQGALFGDCPLAELDAAALRSALDPLLATFESGLDTAELLAIGEVALTALVPAPAAAAPDLRVRRIIDHATANLEQSLDLAAASAGVHLSPSRLRHLFVEQTGLAYKTYLLWLRLVRALQVYAEGRNLTEAAHAAGFADSAHFSRIFRRTFGLPATTLTRI